jgi:hypothetical protein
MVCGARVVPRRSIYIYIYIYIYEACHLFFTTAVTFIIALHVTLHVPFTDLHGLRENDRSVNGVSYGDVTNPGYSLCWVSYGTQLRDRLQNEISGSGHKSHVTFTEPSRNLHVTTGIPFQTIE